MTGQRQLQPRCQSSQALRHGSVNPHQRVELQPAQR